MVKVAVVHSLSNARKLINKVLRGEVKYDFVEVMACPGGCINGGGQIINLEGSDLSTRSKVLYGLDKVNNLRFSHENPEVIECYNTSGAYDYLLKVRARDMKQYQEFVLTKLGDIESLGSLESTFVMSEVKQTYGINL